MSDSAPTSPETPRPAERPRAFRREDILPRIAPFVVSGLVIIALVPFLLGVADTPLVIAAIAIDAVLIVLVLTVPWAHLPRWAESTVPLAGYLILALLRDATGGGPSILSAAGFLIVFWFALHGTRNDVIASLVLMFVTLALPVVLVGDPDYPATELARATLWCFLAGVIALATQRTVDQNWRLAHDAQHLADLRARVNDELREADQLKSQFVAMVSHELRTPLTSIRGFANTIQHHYEELGDSDRRRFAHIIEEQAERLSRLVEDLLTLSRIESGSVSSRPRQFDVADVIDHAVAQFRGTDMTVRCTAGLRVHADPDHVEQILVNFLANAWHYGAPPVTVSAARVGDCVQVVVADHGPGVDPDFVPHLFERFTRDADADDAPAGTGLGLSIVRGLAQAEGGDAWYEPGRDGGACFVVSLPIADPDLADGDEPTPQVAILDR